MSTEKIKEEYDKWEKSYPKIKPIFVIIGFIIFLGMISHAAYLSLEPSDRNYIEIFLMILFVVWMTILVFGFIFGMSLSMGEQYKLSIGYYTKKEIPEAKNKRLKFFILWLISTALFLLTYYLVV